MPFHRPQTVHALAVATSIAGLGAPISTPESTPRRHILSSGVTRRHHFHGEQYHQYRKACYRLAYMAKSLHQTAGAMGALGSPVKLTCGFALSLVQALEGMVVNRQTCSEIADLVTGHLNTIREELDGAAKGDVKFRSLCEDYAETLRAVSQGVALIAHRRRLSQLVHHHSESEELLRFKVKLDTAFQALMLQSGLQTRQMQGHVVTNQQCIVKNQHEQSHILAVLNEKLDSVLEKLDHMVENGSSFEQFVQKLTTCFDDSKTPSCFDHTKILSTHSPASDPTDLLEPTIPMPFLVLATA